MTKLPDTSWAEKGGSRDYITTRPLSWDIGKKNSGWVLTIPAGREFESSVPRPLRWVFSPDDPYFLKSAVIHDTLLEEGFRRAFADSQWFEAALSVHAPGLRTWLAYSGMRSRRFWKWVFLSA
ncbi:DUF1353 domain-containing protein [Leisingera sp. M527]|uniref:DUF1353 domain-containing protein n=1 Tax=Leisingera sp. M527 TaxID=2867014 RepID=UPI0021A31D8F|nr:DUF1353 domain-containing protein [Leisingera sp. M527]UWQ34011.1 DUF1353 domain-containing protein [Leisingera sp. M527]